MYLDLVVLEHMLPQATTRVLYPTGLRVEVDAPLSQRITYDYSGGTTVEPLAPAEGGYPATWDHVTLIQWFEFWHAVRQVATTTRARANPIAWDALLPLWNWRCFEQDRARVIMHTLPAEERVRFWQCYHRQPSVVRGRLFDLYQTCWDYGELTSRDTVRAMIIDAGGPPPPQYSPE